MKVVLFLDHACNLRCRYCYNGASFSRPMPLAVARRGVDMALGGPPEQRALVTFFGGEPLLQMPLIRPIVDHAESEARRRGRRLRMVLVTNGTLLEGDTADFLAEHEIYLGVSLDGCRAAHDANRVHADGSPSFDRVARNVGAYLARGGGPGLRVVAVVDPSNVLHMARSFDSLLELGVRNVAMNINYEAPWTEADRERFHQGLRDLGDRYMDAHRRGVPFTFQLLDDKIRTHLQGGYSCADRCDFGCDEVAVAPSGRLYPCERLVGQDDRMDLVIGHVDQGIDPDRRDGMVAAKNRGREGCGDCALLPRCMHWCGCVNHTLTGSVGEVSGLLCWFEQQIIEEADRCAGHLYGEGVEGFQRRFYVGGGV